MGNVSTQDNHGIMRWIESLNIKDSKPQKKWIVFIEYYLGNGRLKSYPKYFAKEGIKSALDPLSGCL